MNSLNNIISDFFNREVNDNGLEKCNDELKSMGYEEPCLWMISFMFILNYERAESSNLHSNPYGLNISQLEIIASECKKELPISVSQTAKNFQNNDRLSYYSCVKKNIIKYVNLEKDYGIPFESIQQLERYYLDFLNSISVNYKTNKTVKYPMLSDVIGFDEAKKIVLERVIKPSLHRDIYEKYNVKIGGGILLYGLPGTGKTMFAQAISNEINGHFISIKSSDLKSKYYGETEFRIKKLFDEARKHEVSIIFFDEFEAIGTSRNEYGNTAETIVPELLAQMQGFEKNKNIILVLAATNRPWDIDSALLRPGRFDSLIYIDLPNKEARYKIFYNNLRKANLSEEVLDLLAEKTDGYNGSDVKNLSDSIIRMIIDNEINGVKGFSFDLDDVKELLSNSKSSVSKEDVIKMNRFILNNN